MKIILKLRLRQVLQGNTQRIPKIIGQCFMVEENFVQTVYLCTGIPTYYVRTYIFPCKLLTKTTVMSDNMCSLTDKINKLEGKLS